jgi:hypothetical protein
LSFGFVVIILPYQGGKRSTAATAGSGVSSIEMMAAASRRTTAHVISRPDGVPRSGAPSGWFI